jgi:hypothetical protein
MRTPWKAGSALAIGLLVSSAARADRQCQAVVNESIVTIYSTPCDSPVGICTTGNVGPGPLQGTSRFTALKIHQHGNNIFYKGELVITTTSGAVLTLRDAGVLSATTGSFFEVEHVVGGTGARGTLTSQGFATGVGFEGTLSGRICSSGAGANFDDEDSDE